MVKTDHNLIRNFTLYRRDLTAMSVQHNSMQGYRYCQSGKIDSNKYHCGVTAASTCFLSANAGSAVIAENICPDRCLMIHAVCPAQLPFAAGWRLTAIVKLQLKLRTLHVPAWASLALPVWLCQGGGGRRPGAVLMAGPGSLSASLQPWHLMAHRLMDQGHQGTSALSD